MRRQSEQSEKINKRIRSEIIKMREFVRINKIPYSKIKEKSGNANVSRFFSLENKEPSAMSFFLIAEAIGFEVNVNLKK